MLFSKIKNIKLTGIAAAVPTNCIEIESYKETFGSDTVDNFMESSGVKTVHRCKSGQTASDLGFEAAKALLESNDIDKSEIGILIFVTQKQDHRVPSTAFSLQKRLGLTRDCSCFDLNLACSGYIYALYLIQTMLTGSEHNKALLITGDTPVRTISPVDRSMIMLFGDSGTATIVEKDNMPDPAFFSFRTDGKRFKAIITPSGAYRNINMPKERVTWGDGITRSDYDTHMKGMDVFGFSITDVPKLMKEFMEEIGTTPDDYDSFALHQANMFIIKQIYRKLKIPVEKIPIAIDRFGNNSSNSIPLTLSDSYGKMKEGRIRTMMCGFGAGLSWACCDINIDISTILPVIFTDNYYKEF